MASDIWSDILSGWPSETDSEVKRKASDIAGVNPKLGVAHCTLDAALYNRENTPLSKTEYHPSQIEAAQVPNTR
jgi:hypothetical protein